MRTPGIPDNCSPRPAQRGPVRLSDRPQYPRTRLLTMAYQEALAVVDTSGHLILGGLMLRLGRKPEAGFHFRSCLQRIEEEWPTLGPVRQKEYLEKRAVAHFLLGEKELAGKEAKIETVEILANCELEANWLDYLPQPCSDLLEGEPDAKRTTEVRLSLILGNHENAYRDAEKINPVRSPKTRFFAMLAVMEALRISDPAVADDQHYYGGPREIVLREPSRRDREAMQNWVRTMELMRQIEVQRALVRTAFEDAEKKIGRIEAEELDFLIALEKVFSALSVEANRDKLLQSASSREERLSIEQELQQTVQKVEGWLRKTSGNQEPHKEGLPPGLASDLRKLSLELHPDRQQSDPASEGLLKKLNNAKSGKAAAAYDYLTALRAARPKNRPPWKALTADVVLGLQDYLRQLSITPLNLADIVLMKTNQQKMVAYTQLTIRQLTRRGVNIFWLFPSESWSLIKTVFEKYGIIIPE